MGSPLVPAAIVSPTDPLAAATIMRGRFGDATALVACRVVVGTVMAGATPAAIDDRRAHAVVASSLEAVLRRRNVQLWQQNTATGRLTVEMLDAVFWRARALLAGGKVR